MRQCVFCGRWFKNKQAVRAHLKMCPGYFDVRIERKRNRVNDDDFTHDELFESSKTSNKRRPKRILEVWACKHCGYKSLDGGICPECGNIAWELAERKIID